MTNPQWRQLVIEFTAAHQAESVAVRDLGPVLLAAEEQDELRAWFFIRKGHHWRLRYQLAATAPARSPTVHAGLEALITAGSIKRIVENEYEPEVNAFGGTDAITTAHRLWHADCRTLLAGSPATARLGGEHTTELSILLISAMLRAAGLDWYEQGDVWDRVGAHRNRPAPTTRSSEKAVHRLMTVNADTLARVGGPLAQHHEILRQYQEAGSELGDLYWAGRLTRGLRAVLAHHVVFAWNHRGLPSERQALLATTARDVVFGPPTEAAPTEGQALPRTFVGQTRPE